MNPLQRRNDLLLSFLDDGRVLVRSAATGAGLVGPAWMADVLAACSEPRTREEVGDEVAPVFDALAEAGLLAPPEEAASSPAYFGQYAAIDVHRRMLADEPRMDAYARAIAAVVRPGDVVVDAGSGTGVLAVLAARAGARRVYAIEATDFALVIPRIARDSGVGDRVEVVRGDFSQVVLPDKARVLVSEPFGALGVAEGLMEALQRCARNNLEEGGVCIPRRMDLFLAPMEKAPPLLLHPFRLREDGVDLRCLLPEAMDRNANEGVAPQDVGPAICIGSYELPFDGTFSARITVDGPTEALCGWFDLDMAPGVRFSSGPHAPPTHWRQALLPFVLPPGPHALEVASEMAPEDRRTLVLVFEGQGIYRQIRVR